jgi:hypothetical protein
VLFLVLPLFLVVQFLEAMVRVALFKWHTQPENEEERRKWESAKGAQRKELDDKRYTAALQFYSTPSLLFNRTPSYTGALLCSLPHP